MNEAVVLLSGGLDSSTVVSVAQKEGFGIHGITFQYGQRHSVEIKQSKLIADYFKIKKHIIFPLPSMIWSGSSLIDYSMNVPDSGDQKGIPNTYVPARNLVFLALASAYAESLGIKDIFIGVNSIDYSGYPDCRPEFIKAFTQTLNCGTKTVDTGMQWRIHTPLQSLSKAEIIKLAHHNNVPLHLTHSCYNPSSEGLACGKCDSCILRKNGFLQAGIPDPTLYIKD